LNIAPTLDQRTIKRAYAKLLQEYHPEEDPVGFQNLRGAFEEALEKSKYLDSASRSAVDIQCADRISDPNRPVDNSRRDGTSRRQQANRVDSTCNEPIYTGAPEALVQERMCRVANLYADFPRRIDLDRWAEIFADLRMWPVDDGQRCVFIVGPHMGPSWTAGQGHGAFRPISAHRGRKW
jgi:hypothetical protein